MKDNRWVVCPTCARGRKLYPGDKGMVRFDIIDPASSPFIDVRDISGGRGSGFPRIGSITLEEAKENIEYRYLLLQLKDQCERILEVLSDLEGEISENDEIIEAISEEDGQED